MSNNPINKMFTGKKYMEKNNEQTIPVNLQNMDIKELERFYKSVRDTQLKEIRDLIVNLNREGEVKLDKIVIKLNDFISRDVVDNVDRSLKTYKRDLDTALNQNYYTINKRITELEKFIFIFGLILFFLMIPNIVAISRLLLSFIRPLLWQYGIKGNETAQKRSKFAFWAVSDMVWMVLYGRIQYRWYLKLNYDKIQYEGRWKYERIY